MDFIPFKERKPKGSRYGINSSYLVCNQNVFCYRPDFRSYLKANYPESLPFALKSTLAFEIHWVMFFLLRCLLLSSFSSLLALNFKSTFSPQRIFPCQIFPEEDLQPVVELGVLVFAVLSICMRNRLRFTDSKHCFGDAVALDIVSQTQ